ncbi:MAG: GNAT family N-acetyltransferase [Bryobacteraceae bacterium]|jgi:hypothetical protein
MSTLQTICVSPAELLQFRGAWEQLVENALVPNVFFEPWMLLPAIEHLREDDNLHFLLVHGPAVSNGARKLWGLFPLQVQHRCLHLPLRTLALWQHRYCYLTAPLIERHHAEEVLDAFWRWFETNPLGCRILDTNYLLADGPFHTAWADFLIGRCTLVLNEFPRGLQTRAASYESYIETQLSKKRHHALSRSRRHLEQLGSLVSRQIDRVGDLELWMEKFLRLESSGWKGRQGTALASKPEDAQYFRELTNAAFRKGRATLLSLELNGNPIAMKHVLSADDGSFDFKIAYDEDYSKYSPGLLLELDHLRMFHSESRSNWIDSGASARHPLFDLVSNERRLIRRTLISNGSRRGDFYVSALPLMRWLKHKLAKPSPALAKVGAAA